MKTSLLSFSLAISAIACAPALPPVPYNPTAQLLTPSGKVGYTIACSSEGECLQWAGYRCQSPYAILSKEVQTSSNMQAGGFGRAWQFARNQETHMYMVVECASRPNANAGAINPSYDPAWALPSSNLMPNAQSYDPEGIE